MTSIDCLKYFETYLLTERRVSNNTFVAYKKDIEQLANFLDSKSLSVSNCGDQDLKSYVHSISESSAKTVSRKISSIKLFYSFLSERYGFTNVAAPLVFPKIEQKLPTYLTDEEIGQLFGAADLDKTTKGIRNKLIIHILYATGMRVSELVNLSVDQIHLDTGFLHVNGKGNKERQIPLPKTTLDFLSEYLNTTYKELHHASESGKNYLFSTKIKTELKPLTRQSVWNIVRDLIRDANIAKNVSPHSLRHSLATHLLKNGADIRSLQMLLGHEQISTVAIYTHLETGQVRKIYDKKHPRA